MPVDAIQPYQIIIMVVFLLLLMVALFLVRRFRVCALKPVTILFRSS